MSLFHRLLTPKEPTELDRERAAMKQRIQEMDAGIRPCRSLDLLTALTSDAITSDEYDEYLLRWKREGWLKNDYT